MIRLVVLARMRRWEGVSLFLEEMAVRIQPGRAVTAKQWGNGGGGGEQKAAALSWAHSPLMHLRSMGESLSRLL